MLDKLFLSRILILFLAVLFFTQCKTQTAENTVKVENTVRAENKIKPENTVKNSNAAVTQMNLAPDEAQIVKKIIDYKIGSKELSSLQSQPAPEVSFIFPPPSETEVKMPENVKIFLKEYWQETLKLRYEMNTDKSSKTDAPNNQTALDNLSEKTRAKLEESKINAPKGERGISTREARQIIMIFDRTADELIKKVKSL